MIIKNVTFKNFGLYSGVQTFDFMPESKTRNIILIGGENGHGKTTLFEGIRLCLYGDQIVESRAKKRDYEKLLKSKIHYNPNKELLNLNASVSIELVYEKISTFDTFEITRSWKYENELSEEFHIKKNGSKLNEVEIDQWQNFIRDLIPFGLSQLFFFDGEKIQNLAEEKVDTIELANSFKTLLGIDIIEKLKSDLDNYSLKNLDSKNSNELKDSILLLKSELDVNDQKLSDLIQKKADIQNDIDSVLLNIEKEEQKIVTEGGNFSIRRDNMKEEKTKMESNITHLEEELRIFSSELLPLAFAPKLSLKLMKQLKEEEKHKHVEITKDQLLRNKEKIIEQINVKSKFDNKDFYVLLNIFSKNSKFKIVHNLSSVESALLINKIEKSVTEIPNKLIKIVKELEKSYDLLNRVNRDLTFAPSENIISPYLKRINEFHFSLSELKIEMANLDESIKKEKFQIELKTRELAKLKSKIKDDESLSDKLKMVNNIQDALEEYHEKIMTNKVKEFSHVFIETFDKLAKKKGIFSKAELNPFDYSVTLYKKNKKVSKKELSAGEKQIYAIAILWTLTKMSRRPLPFIIDTPLGRLDKTHRSNIITNFIPVASKQVIILSTNTEIDYELFEQLKPCISKSYNLSYDNGETKINEGYYW